jgi:hypothetical protein
MRVNRWLGKRTGPHASHPHYYSHRETYTVKQSAASLLSIHPKHRIALSAYVENLEYIQHVTKLTLKAEVTSSIYEKSEGF